MNNKFSFLNILLIFVVFFIILDVAIGKYLYKKFIRKNFTDINHSYRIKDDIFDHSFLPSFKGLASWGNTSYDFCTNSNSFRDSCSNQFDKTREYDLAFIGDSFTESLGINYEESFVGLISSVFKNKKIANLAVSSYSPAIYYAKINYLLNEGYKFNEVIVFIDLSDLKDETSCYSLSNDKVIQRKTYKNCYKNIAETNNTLLSFFNKNFLLSSQLYKLITQYKVPKDILEHSRSSWTYEYEDTNYNNYKYEESIKIILNNMNKLSNLLNQKNIPLSIAVYPWPNTLINDTQDNKHTKLWKNFCINNNCKNFYNLMPLFFNELKKDTFVEVYQKLYIKNDVHLNIYGHKIVADFFIKNYRE